METLLKPAEAAEILRVSIATIYAWVAQRRIPAQKVGNALRFVPSELARWLKEQSRPPGEPSGRISREEDPT